MSGLHLAAVAVVALVSGGCLDAPKIEDRWTRIDLVGASLTPNQTVPSGSPQAISVQAKVTYRAILTGFAVADLRASGSLSAADLAIHPDAARVPMANDIDRLLQNSVSLGRATRAVTGWDHLIQPLDFTFAATPQATDSSGAANGLFLVCYLGAGERVEVAGGADSLIITPFPSTPYEILPVGMELMVTAARSVPR